MEVRFVTGNKPAILHGICPDEDIGDRTPYHLSSAFALYMLVPRLVSFKNGILTTAEINSNSKACKDNILLMYIPAKRRSQFNVCYWRNNKSVATLRV